MEFLTQTIFAFAVIGYIYSIKDHKKKFKVNGPTLDFNSSYRDSFEDELVKKVEECIKEFKECVKA